MHDSQSVIQAVHNPGNRPISNPPVQSNITLLRPSTHDTLGMMYYNTLAIQPAGNLSNGSLRTLDCPAAFMHLSPPSLSLACSHPGSHAFRHRPLHRFVSGGHRQCTFHGCPKPVRAMSTATTALMLSLLRCASKWSMLLQTVNIFPMPRNHSSNLHWKTSGMQTISNLCQVGMRSWPPTATRRVTQWRR